jgi:hypothetical protein
MSRCLRQGWAQAFSTLAFLLLLSSTVFAGIFPSPINVPVTGADAIAVGDFNGDGKLDIVVADGASSTVQVLLNDGTGGIASSVSSVSAASVPASLVVGDFNGDGKLDVALHNKFDLQIIVLLGKGDGSFQSPIKTATSNSGRLVTGDFNNDGHLDLATGNQIFRGKGDGTFQPSQTLSYAGAFYCAGDLNSDGNLDLVGNDGTGFSILLGKGDGSFQGPNSTPITGTLRSLAVADMNGDRKIDVVAGVDSGSGGQVQVYLGNNDGTLQAALTQSTSVTDPYEISVADFTADGHRDVVVAGGVSQPVSLLSGSGTGGLQAETLLPLGFAENVAGASMASADLDGNGVPDLVAPSAVSGRVMIWLSKTAGGFTTASAYPYSGGVVASADFNGDARPDTIFSDISIGKVGVMLDQTDGTLASPVYTSLTTAPIAGIIPADLNADGILDIVFWTSSMTANNVTTAGSTYAALGKGDGTFQPATVVSQTLASQAVVKDLNGDGLPDIADLDTAPGNVSVFLGKGDGTFGFEIGYPTAPGATYIAAGAVNGDGHPDLITAGAGGVNLLLNNGDGSYAFYSSISTIAAVSLGVADVDGDGKLDLVVVSGTGSATVASIYLGSGSGTFTKASQFALGGATSIKFADINKDGLLDIVADEGSATGVWLNTKAGTFAKVQDLALGGVLALADINTDGLPDLLQVSSSHNFLTLAYNQFGTASAGDFTVSAAQATPTVSAGDKTTLTLTLGSLNGYAGIVTLSCSGLPAATTCTFSPVSVTIPGNATTATVTIQTSLDSVSSLQSPGPARRHWPIGWSSSGGLLCGVMLTAAGVSGRRRLMSVALLVSLSLLTLVSCSSNATSVPPIASPNPKSVTTQVTISAAAGTVIHSTQIALTITK